MEQLTNNTITLRALEPEDLNYIYEIENNQSLWNVSNTQTPYSRYLIKQYLENAHQDIYEAKQFRFIIEGNAFQKPVGLIDLFDFDPKNERVGIGILISEPENRNKGYATEAVAQIITFVKNHLHCHQIFVNIHTDNIASIKLFTKFGFELIGIKKDWNREGKTRKDEAMYQLIF